MAALFPKDIILNGDDVNKSIMYQPLIVGFFVMISDFFKKELFANFTKLDNKHYWDSIGVELGGERGRIPRQSL